MFLINQLYFSVSLEFINTLHSELVVINDSYIREIGMSQITSMIWTHQLWLFTHASRFPESINLVSRMIISKVSSVWRKLRSRPYKTCLWRVDWTDLGFSELATQPWLSWCISSAYILISNESSINWPWLCLHSLFIY